MKKYNITLREFLQMSSGLEWVESYALMSDVTRMLYSKPDPVSFVVSDKFPQACTLQ
jgi:CubicO group peptidase (beta-lactamase class C family)